MYAALRHDQILDQLRAGEDGRAEFMEARLGDRGMLSPDTEALAGELVAFANAAGGHVFVGVADSGAVAGIPPSRVDGVERWIVNVATHNCEPPIRPTLRKILLPDATGDDRQVLLAEVPRGLYVHRTSGGRYYVRVGSTKLDLTPPELARLFRERGREYVFNEQAVLRAAVDDLNRHRLEAFFGRSPTIPWLDLRNTRVTFRDENDVDRPPSPACRPSAPNRPTSCPPPPSKPPVIAASGCRPTTSSTPSGLPGRCPTRSTRGFPSSRSSCSRRRTPDQAMAVPMHDTTSTSVDEAMVNAVAHRDHAISGSKIRLFLFADRLELYSPGKLPDTITLDEMPYRTFTRNQLLVSFLSRVWSKRTGQVFLESRSERARKILQDGEAHSGRRPRYELFGDELRLTLWATSSTRTA